MAVFKTKNKTKDGRQWVFKIYYEDLRGNTKQKLSKQHHTRKEALDAEREYKNSLDNNIDSKTNIKNMTLKDLRIKHKDFKQATLKDTTVSNYNDRDRYIEFFDEIKVLKFTISHYEKWKKYMYEFDISNAYRNDILKYFKAILNYGSKYYKIYFADYNLMTNFNNPNEIKKEMDFYTYEEFLKFISVVSDIRDSCLFKTLYFCGLRRSEARGLKWSDIDFNCREVSINKQVLNPKGYTSPEGYKWKITTLKTKSSKRVLPIPKNLLDDLKTLLCELQQYTNFSSDWFVFGDIQPLSYSIMWSRKNNYSKEANIKNIRLHDFRHSCASLLINNGANITIVAKYLGHTKIDETLNTYSHLFKNKMDDIVNVIDNL